jgi:hypothetical protein
MMPTIETIIEDLLEGKISKPMAITWLLQHAEGAHRDLRDYFAAKAMQGLISHMNVNEKIVPSLSYKVADGMIEARKK